MPVITIVQLTDSLAERLKNEELACELVGLALADLGWPVRDDYSPQEALTIWSKLAEVQARFLVQMDTDEAQALGEAMLPWIALMQDQVALLREEATAGG